MFPNLLSLYPHFQILTMIDGKYGGGDVLLIPLRINVYRHGKQKIIGGIPKKAKEFMAELKIDLDTLYKKL